MQCLGGIFNFDLFSNNMPHSGIALRGECRNAVSTNREPSVSFDLELNANTMILKTQPKAIAFEERNKRHVQSKR